MHTFSSGRFGAPRSIYTPLEGADEREGRQQKEKRKTCAGVKGEKISSQNGLRQQLVIRGRDAGVCVFVCVGVFGGEEGWWSFQEEN